MNAETTTVPAVTTNRVPFSLPTFGSAKFTIEPGTSLADLAEGVYLLLDIGESISCDIAHKTPNDENAAHGLRTLLAIARATTGAVLSELRPGIVEAEEVQP